MAITAYSSVRHGNATTVTVTSDLSGTIYYHWYSDGAYIASTTSASRSFLYDTDDQSRITVQDTNDADYDPIANAPVGYPAKRTVTWIRSIDSDVARYRIEQQLGAGSWAVIGLVQHVATTWQYELLTPRLDDLGVYTWRMIPVDAAGNDGTARTLDAETIVRTPDAPRFTIAFDGGTTKVTFAMAA